MYLQTNVWCIIIDTMYHYSQYELRFKFVSLLVTRAYLSPFHLSSHVLLCYAVGRFKKAIPFAHVFTGQAYDTPIDHIPAKWLVNAALQFMTRLQPAHQVRLEGDHPYILSPLASTAQKIGESSSSFSSLLFLTITLLCSSVYEYDKRIGSYLN